MPRTLGDSFLHVDRISHLVPVDIGMARYDVDPKSNLADVAFVVRDEWQGKGVGTLLMRRMAEIARARGISGFEADVLLTNKAMMRVQALSRPARRHEDAGGAGTADDMALSAVEILRTEKGGARRLPTRQEQAELVCLGACLAAVLLASVLLTGVPPDIAVVSLEFDDTLANQFSARSILAEHRMHATFFVNSGRLDRPGYLTVAELRALASDGHEIGGHTIAHARLPGLPAREQRHQICDDRRALHALGFDVSDFAYPAGEYDSASAEQVRSCGYESAREAGGIGYPPCIFCTWAETIPPRDPMATRTPGSLRRAHSLPRIQAPVRRAQRVGGWIQLTFHHLCDACDDYSISTEDFSTLLDWLAEEREAGRVAVLTVRQVIRGATPPPRRLAAE